MQRFLIFRHAKTEPHDEAHDRERRLIDRGRKDATLMGHVMRAKGYLPNLVLCSSSTRTKETWEHAAPALGDKTEVVYLDELYDAPEKSLLATIHHVEKPAPVLMYIGHNPGLENLARRLVRKPKEPAEIKRIAAMEKKFPTSAVAVLDFAVTAWRDIDAGQGTLYDYLVPADLKDR